MLRTTHKVLIKNDEEQNNVPVLKARNFREAIANARHLDTVPLC